MRSRKGFTLIELMVVVLIVAILAAIALPILRGRIDAAKWSEGKAIMGTIATAIRAYHAEKGPSGGLPGVFGVASNGLGFIGTDLDGTFFSSAAFAFAVTTMDPLTFTVSCTAAGGNTRTNRPANPTSESLNQDGIFTP